MKRILLVLLMLMFSNSVFAYEIVKNEEYYKTQIQNQRSLYNITGLFNAIQKKRPDLVELYMKAGFDPNSKYMGTPAIFFAALCKQPLIVKILLDYGANPEEQIPPLFVSFRSTNILVYSIEQKNSDSVKALIEHKVDVNKKLHSKIPLNYAIENKQMRIVEMLIKANALPDRKSFELVEKSKDQYLKELFKNKQKVL